MRAMTTWVLGLLVVTGCASAPGDMVRVEIDPVEVLFKQRATVTVTAQTADRQPGTGVVELMVPVGTLGATTLELDAEGRASTWFECKTLVSCVGRVLFEATWRHDGVAVKGNAVATLGSAGEGRVVIACDGASLPGLSVACCSPSGGQPVCPAAVVAPGAAVFIPFAAEDGSTRELLVRWVAPPSLPSSVPCAEANLDLVALDGSDPVSLTYSCSNSRIDRTGRWVLNELGGCQTPAASFLRATLCPLPSSDPGVAHTLSEAAFTLGSKRYLQADGATYVFVLRRG